MEKIKTIDIKGNKITLRLNEVKDEIKWLESTAKKYDKPEYKPLINLIYGRRDALNDILHGN